MSAATDGIADLGPITKQRIIASGVVGSVDHPIIHFVTKVFGTVHTIINDRGLVGLATKSLVAGLGAIAEEAIVTPSIVWVVEYSVGGFVTGIGGACDTIIENGRCARLATSVYIAPFRPVTEQTVVAAFIYRPMFNAIRRFITDIFRAALSVIH